MGTGTGVRTSSGRNNNNNDNNKNGGGGGGGGVGYFEQMFFGAPVQEYNTIATAEMNKVGV